MNYGFKKFILDAFYFLKQNDPQKNHKKTYKKRLEGCNLTNTSNNN